MGVISSLNTGEDQECGPALRRTRWGLLLAVCGSYHKPVKGFYPLSAEGEGSKIKVLAGVAPTGGPEEVCPIPLLDSDDRQQSLVFLGL